jgi:hypothetical protein
MVELPLDEVPRDGEIVEVFYRLSHSAQAYIDLRVSVDGAERHLRFSGARVVVFREEPPPVLVGLDVQDVREQQIQDASLRVSVADGAITFWAKTITDLTRPQFEPRPSPPDPSEDEIPLVLPDDWATGGLVTSSFRYQARAPRGVLQSLALVTQSHPDFGARPPQGPGMLMEARPGPQTQERPISRSR